MAKCIGLTGGIASGKSQVRQLFEEKSFKTLSADEVVHSLMKKDEAAYLAILQEFGPGILDEKQEIHRKALGDKVFNDPKALQKLEGILHPLVKNAFEAWKAENESEDWIVYEIPLLFEKNRQKDFDLIYCVYADTKKQIERVMKRDSISEEQAFARIKNQIPQEIKIAQSDIVLENNFDNINQLKQAFIASLEKISEPKSSQS